MFDYKDIDDDEDTPFFVIDDQAVDRSDRQTVLFNGASSMQSRDFIEVNGDLVGALPEFPELAELDDQRSTDPHRDHDEDADTKLKLTFSHN